jgi:hypothetical protein
MKRTHLIITLLFFFLEGNAQELTICENVQTVEEIESVYKLKIDSSGNLYGNQLQKVDSLAAYVLKAMHAQFDRTQKIHVNRWFIELEANPDILMKYITPWIEEVREIGFPKIIYPAKSKNFEPIEGIWRTGVIHQLVVVDSKFKIIDQFLDEISIPPPPPDFPGDKNRFYVNYNISVETELDSITLELNNQEFEATLSDKIDNCFIDKSCHIFLDVDPIMTYREFISNIALINKKISGLREEYSSKKFNENFEFSSGKNKYLTESRFPILIEIKTIDNN